MAFLYTNNLSYQVLNGPMSISNLFAYYFFAFCLSFWQDGTKPIKQPLKFVLASFVALMATVQIVILSSVFHTWYIWSLLLFCLIQCGLTTVVWLGVFYYTQIVPPQSWFTIWLQKNIKRTVYIVLTLDKLLFLTDIFVRNLPAYLHYVHNMNITSGNSSDFSHELVTSSRIIYYSRVLYIFLSSIVMTSASVATVRYLKRHMKNMESTRSPFTTTVRSQLRVTRMCTMQGVLNILFATFFLLAHLFANVGTVIDDSIFFTVVSLYSLGTALNFCVGQPLFRMKVINLWLKVSILFQLKYT